jgi:FkbM family methyltransferase
MDLETDEVSVGNFKVSVIRDDQYIGACLRRGVEWDGWMRQDLPHIYKPGTDILDIGGNIGWNAMMFSDYGPVHTFEPLFHKVITKNVSQNTFKNPVEVHPYALSCAEGTMPIWSPKRDESGLCNYGGSGFMKNESSSSRHELVAQVPIKRLDDVYKGTASVIKLDVEGHELEVLQGGLETIRRGLPAMYIEIFSEHETIINLLSPLGYDIIIPRPEHNYLFLASRSQKV